MFRAVVLLVSSLSAMPALAQSRPSGAECVIRMNAAPSSWMIEGHDPFGGALPEGTFGVSFTNDGSAECSFVPVFELDQPPFGLTKGTGKPIRYALLNMTDTLDVTPRASRSARTLSQRAIALAPNETRTVLYKLVANPDDVKEAGTFTQSVTLEAQDTTFRSLGGTRLVLGLNILPSARIGLAGAYSMSNGHATVDLGELREGPAPVPLQLRVSSTGRYEINVNSANAGRLRLGTTGWYVPYSLAIGGRTVNLAGGSVPGQPEGEERSDALSMTFTIGEVDGRRAGTYSDVISISVAAR